MSHADGLAAFAVCVQSVMRSLAARCRGIRRMRPVCHPPARELRSQRSSTILSAHGSLLTRKKESRSSEQTLLRRRNRRFFVVRLFLPAMQVRSTLQAEPGDMRTIHCGLKPVFIIASSRRIIQYFRGKKGQKIICAKSKFGVDKNLCQ